MSLEPRGAWDGRSAPILIAVGAIIALLSTLLIWDTASSYTENRLFAERNADAYAAQIEANVLDCADPSNLECATQNLAMVREHQRAEFDLAAQRDMAKWAMAMFAVSAFGTLAGLIGIAFVYRTLKAAQEGNQINRRVGQAQVRAYLSVFEGTYQVWGNVLILVVSIRNSGQSPARSGVVEWQVEYDSARPDRGNLAREKVISTSVQTGFVNVAASGSETAEYRFSIDEGLGDNFFEHWRVRFYVRGAVRWIDVFGDGDEETFLLMSEPNADYPAEGQRSDDSPDEIGTLIAVSRSTAA